MAINVHHQHREITSHHTPNKSSLANLCFDSDLIAQFAHNLPHTTPKTSLKSFPLRPILLMSDATLPTRKELATANMRDGVSLMARFHWKPPQWRGQSRDTTFFFNKTIYGEWALTTHAKTFTFCQFMWWYQACSTGKQFNKHLPKFTVINFGKLSYTPISLEINASGTIKPQTFWSLILLAISSTKSSKSNHIQQFHNFVSWTLLHIKIRKRSCSRHVHFVNNLSTEVLKLNQFATI